ncbi:MAG: DNA-protecting protein DprA [Acidobacteria bacterium]|nr:DNA-protecting protein DprA [Acidobacteriota bacterium]
MRGNVDALARTAIAIVGSRRPTTYGLRMAELLAAGVASRGLVVASGLARGIDARAHEGALDVGGLTVAVLGCGLDRDYPRENTPLAKRIEEAGALVSEFPPGTEPIATNFPRRNRIIVGLSDAVVIVEAEIPSGTLVTARWATEESRVLLAVPGRVLDPTSAGPISLIRDGVKPACTPEDIFEELAPERRPHDVTPRAEDQPVPSARRRASALKNERFSR